MTPTPMAAAASTARAHATPAAAGARTLIVDVLVVGGGLGGVAAALAVARHGRRVHLTDEYAWLGGQLTSQGVPPDEHPWNFATASATATAATTR
jgi:NADPH-dependent 2,4-dienoyl-CoA reductase/sulfur reductase-like enzyme